jgi:hypothetical protein
VTPLLASRRDRMLLRIAFVLLAAASSGSSVTHAQDSATYQRVYPRPVADVRTAVLSLHASTRGRLPTLEGFVVEQAKPPLFRYDKGFYECTFDVAPAIGGGTVVTVSTKITAFLNDPDTGVSGYRVLISNGRLENDALDRVEDALNPNAAAATAAAAPPPDPPASTSAPASKPAPANGGLRPARNFAPPTSTYNGSVPASTASSPGGESSSRSDSSPAETRAPRTAVAPAAPLPTGESVEQMRAERYADERKAQDLNAYVRNLESIQQNQSRPADLAVVRKAKTPIFTKSAEGAPVLMMAEAEDEFQVLDVSGPWVHVQISGASRGWMRRAQVEMPAGFAQVTETADARAASGSGPFKLSKEETNPFSGTWDKLHGKNVRIEWVEAPGTTTPGEKLAFAKTIFLKAYDGLGSSHENVEGIVVVFDAADGGQIAATLASVKQLADKSISEAAFWRECSLDPPDTFQVSGK